MMRCIELISTHWSLVPLSNGSGCPMVPYLTRGGKPSPRSQVNSEIARSTVSDFDTLCLERFALALCASCPRAA